MKKVTLTTPETTASITSHQAVRVEVDASSGNCDVIMVKKDAGGNQLGSYRVQVTLGANPLKQFLADVLAEAQTEEKVPAGTVGDA